MTAITSPYTFGTRVPEPLAAVRPRVATRLLFRHWNTWRERVRSHVLLVPLGPRGGGRPVDLTPGDRDVPPWMRGGIGDLAVSADGGMSISTPPMPMIGPIAMPG